MNNLEVGIGIIDIYNDDSLDKCIKSLMACEDSDKMSSYIISNRKVSSKSDLFVFDKTITREVSMASLRNHCLAHFRSNGLKYIFLLNSNVQIKDPQFVKKTIATAEAFGTWFMTGFSEGPTYLDDSDLNQTLAINGKLNTDFLFLRSGVVGTLGYFDERFVNTKNLDVLDYIIKARKAGIYPPHPFHPTVGDYCNFTSDKIERIGHCDILDPNTRSVGFSYGYFHHQHKYIPDHDEIKQASKEDLMVFMGDLQKNYATPK